MVRILTLFALLLGAAYAQSAGTCRPRVLAGVDVMDPRDGLEGAARFFVPSGLAEDTNFNLYIADAGQNRVRMVRQYGEITTIAGTGEAGGAGDGGPAAMAQLDRPWRLAIGPDRSIYIVEAGGRRVRQVRPDGTIRTIIGVGAQWGAAEVSQPIGVAVDPAGDVYVSDRRKNRIQRISPKGQISTAASNLQSPGDLAAGPDGTVYVAVSYGILAIAPNGTTRTYAGTLSSDGQAIGHGAEATKAVVRPVGLAMDPNGKVVFANFDATGRVFRVSADGKLEWIASTGLMTANGLLVESGYVVQSDSSRGVVNRYAIASPPLSDLSPLSTTTGSNARSADIRKPAGIATGPDGSVYVADATDARIRKIGTDGAVSTFAGTGVWYGPAPEGASPLATSVTLPTAVGVSAAGDVYYAESGNPRIRKISGGVVTTVVGNGNPPMSEPNDGDAATSIGIYAETMAVDRDGNVYFVAGFRGRTYRAGPDGKVHLAVADPIAGMSTDATGSVWYSAPTSAGDTALYQIDSDGKPQLKRKIRGVGPEAFTVDAHLNVYMGPPRAIRKFAADGTTTFLTDARAPDDFGSAFDTLLPTRGAGGLALAPSGALYVSDPLRAQVTVVDTSSCTAARLPYFIRDGAANAANYDNTRFAPGELVTVFGEAMGPEKVSMSPIQDGRLATTAAGTQVLVDGEPAPVYYASAGQISFFMPYRVAGQVAAEVQVVSNGFASPVKTLTIAEAAPGIFTQDSSGKGPGSILNAADYSLNSAARPAKKGSTIAVYATGLGAVDPPMPDGSIGGLPLSWHTTTFKALVDGVDAKMSYAGSVYSLFAGVSQVNVEIPAAARSGAVSLKLIGPYATPDTGAATVYVE